MSDRHWRTVAETAADVKAALDRQAHPSDVLRLVVQGVNWLDDARDRGRLEEMLSEPPSAGDPRWDALIAGSVRFRLRKLGLSAPTWTKKDPLPRFWSPVRVGAAWDAHQLATRPVEFARLGILLSAEMFETA